MFPELLYTAAAAAKSLQSCSTLCDPIDGSPPAHDGGGLPKLWDKEHLEDFPVNCYFSACRYMVVVVSVYSP